MSAPGSITHCHSQWIRAKPEERMFKTIKSVVVAASILIVCLPYSEQCSARNEKVDKKATEKVTENPFKNYLGKRTKQRKFFSSPKNILYGFKPVNMIKTFLDKIPGISTQN